MEFFSPIEEDAVSRTEQDEDAERIAHKTRKQTGDAGQVFAVWNQEARAKIASGGIKPRVLLVAASDLACRLLHHGGLTLNPLGSLLVAGVSARGNAVEPTHRDSSGFVHEVVSGDGGGGDDVDVVIAFAQYDVPAAAAREWSNTLLAAVAPRERVVIVAAVDEHDVDYGADGRRGAYVMDTAAMRNLRVDSRSEAAAAASDVDVDTSNARTPPPPPFYVPSGALLAGVAAGVLSRCEMTGVPARLVAVPAPSGTAGSRGLGGSPAGRGAGGFGPGFGGGVDPAAVEHALGLVERTAGMSLKRGVNTANGVNTAVGDSMRVFV